MSLRNIALLTVLSFLSLSVDAKPITNVRKATPTSLALPGGVVFPSTLPLIAGQSPSPCPVLGKRNVLHPAHFITASPKLNSN
jgi:hypothetical protein